VFRGARQWILEKKGADRSYGAPSAAPGFAEVCRGPVSEALIRVEFKGRDIADLRPLGKACVPPSGEATRSPIAI